MGNPKKRSFLADLRQAINRLTANPTTEPIKVEIIPPSTPPPTPQGFREQWLEGKGSGLIILLISVLAVAIILVWLGLVFIFPQQRKLMTALSTFQITLSSPQYISVGDNEEVLVTVTNLTTQIITDTRVVLVYSDTLSSTLIMSMSPDTSSSVSFDKLEPGERETKLIELSLKQTGISWLNQTTNQAFIELGVWLITNNNSTLPLNTYQLQIAPIYRIRWWFYGVVGVLSSLIIWLGKEFWSYMFSEKNGK